MTCAAWGFIFLRNTFEHGQAGQIREGMRRDMVFFFAKPAGQSCLTARQPDKEPAEAGSVTTFLQRQFEQFAHFGWVASGT
ncbi:MAG: hypothetical protein ACTJHY_05560, partial [Alcaligenes pakistanensis]